MHVIIAGGGKGGRRLVSLFRSHPDHKVTLVDSDPKTCESISELFPDVDIVLGDVTHPDTLREANSRNARTFIAITGDDRLNLLAAKAAEVMGVPIVMLRIGEREYRELGEVFELNNILDPADSTAAQIVTRLNGVDFSDLVHELYPRIEVQRFAVADHSEMLGQPAGEFSEYVDAEAYPILILRDQEYRLPSGVDTLKEGDQVIAWIQNPQSLVDRFKDGKRQ